MVGPKRKRIRLDADDYRVPGMVIAITITTRERMPVLTDDRMNQECVDLLRTSAERRCVRVMAYCLMPDHVHLLLMMKSDSDLIGFVREFKSLTTRTARQFEVGEKIWQRSFYDHVLRENEDPAKQIQYMLGNPVKNGLVDRWDQYRWIGSFEFDIRIPENWESSDFNDL